MARKTFRPLIVGLGHPRCGTGFTANLLQAAGLDIGHERLRADGMVSWMAVAERRVVPYGDTVGKLKGHRIFCAVRSPLDAIPSIMPENERPRSIAWRAQVLWERSKIDICSRPFVPPHKVAVAIASYVHWFELCLACGPDLIFRIDRAEDDAALGEFAERQVQRNDALRRNARPRLRVKDFKPPMIARAGPALVTRLADLADRFGYPEDAATIRAQLPRAEQMAAGREAARTAQA